MPKISERIENNETSAGVMLGLVSVAVGILNAACMSY
jgi:putative membrane protein